MGRHYLKHSNRYPQRFRHLRRTWPASGLDPSKIDAPIANTPRFIGGANNAWRVEITHPSPNWTTDWSVTIKRAVIATGAALPDLVKTFVVVANQTPVQVAQRFVSTVGGLAEVDVEHSGTDAFCDIKLADPLNKITSVFVGAVSGAVPAGLGEEAPDEVPPAPAPAPPPAPRAVKKSASKAG